MRNFLLVLHIIGVCIWLGANVVQAFLARSVAEADRDTRAWWAAAQGSMARVLYNVAGITILITGILMLVATDSPYSFSSTFVSIGFVAILVGAGLGMGVFGPGSRNLESAIKAGDRPVEASLGQRLLAFGALDTLVIIVTIWAMVAKLGA